MEPKIILRAETEERKICGNRSILSDEKEKRNLTDLVENEINLFATQFVKSLVKKGYIIKMFKRGYDLFEHCFEMDFLPFKNMCFICVDGNRIKL